MGSDARHFSKGGKVCVENYSEIKGAGGKAVRAGLFEIREEDACNQTAIMINCWIRKPAFAGSGAISNICGALRSRFLPLRQRSKKWL
ncbi:MAG: hypothetical protein P8X96_23435 [Desulfobacteraceae bacterium]